MTIRWGIIGCGDVVRKRVASAIQRDPNSELVAVCRRDKQKLAQFSADFKVAHTVDRYEALLDFAPLDAVYIATPVNLHCEQTIAFAKSGKHVLVEKPMAMSVDECDRMIDACRVAGVKLGVAYYRQFYPVVERIRSIMTSGEIGKIMSFHVTSGIPFTIQPNEDGYWRILKNQSGGGPVMDIGSHRIDLLTSLFGKVRRIRSSGLKTHGFEVEDNATVLLEFESDVQGTLQVFYGASDVPDHISVVGSKGRIIAEPLNDGRLTIVQNGARRDEVHSPADNLNAPLIADFVQAILENREPLVTGESGRETNRIMSEAYRDAGFDFESTT